MNFTRTHIIEVDLKEIIAQATDSDLHKLIQLANEKLKTCQCTTYLAVERCARNRQNQCDEQN